eukprot:GEMP01033374.1.p1 GENE.GEMP01033374.1~~GEMP01033374.1.p1  ORF type:complete len:432 (+),score=98.87 GEMP01033374.1:92-1387(+)
MDVAVRHLEILAQSAQSYLWPTGRPLKIVDGRISCDPLHALEELQVGRHPACTMLCQALAGLRILGSPRQSQAFFVVLTYLLTKRGRELCDAEGHDIQDILSAFDLFEGVLVDAMRESERPMSPPSHIALMMTGSQFSFVLMKMGKHESPVITKSLCFRIKDAHPFDGVFHTTLCVLGSVGEGTSAALGDDADDFVREFEDFVNDSQLDSLILSGSLAPGMQSVLHKKKIPFFVLPAVMVEAAAAVADATLLSAFDVLTDVRPSWLRCQVHATPDSAAACYPLLRGAEPSTWYQAQALLELDEPSPYEIHLSGRPNSNYGAPIVTTVCIQEPCEPLLRMEHAELLDELRGGASPSVTEQWLFCAHEKLKSQSGEMFRQMGPVIDELICLREDSPVVEKLEPSVTAARRAIQLAGITLQTTSLPGEHTPYLA